MGSLLCMPAALNLEDMCCILILSYNRVAVVVVVVVLMLFLFFVFFCLTPFPPHLCIMTF